MASPTLVGNRSSPHALRASLLIRGWVDRDSVIWFDSRPVHYSGGKRAISWQQENPILTTYPPHFCIVTSPPGPEWHRLSHTHRRLSWEAERAKALATDSRLTPGDLTFLANDV